MNIDFTNLKVLLIGDFMVDHYIIGKSRSSFTLLPKKGINLPNSLYDEKKQLEIYFSENLMKLFF